MAADTGATPPDALTASSRSTVHMGNAVRAACHDLLERLAADRPSGDAEAVGQGTYAAEADPTHPLGGPTPFYEAVATAVELSVDERTGHLDIERIVHVTDAGRVLDPVRARGLDEGGLVMGIGLGHLRAGRPRCRRASTERQHARLPNPDDPGRPTAGDEPLPRER